MILILFSSALAAVIAIGGGATKPIDVIAPVFITAFLAAGVNALRSLYRR